MLSSYLGNSNLYWLWILLDGLSEIDADSIQIILVFINIGWALVVILIVFSIRYKESIISNAHLRLGILITLNIILFISGILIIHFSNYDSTGSGIIIISIYLNFKEILSIEFLTRKFSVNILNIVEFAGIILMVFAWMIIALLILENNSKGSFAVISYPIFLLCSLSFIKYYHANKDDKNNIEVPFFVYSPTLFPKLKYVPASGNFLLNQDLFKYRLWKNWRHAWEQQWVLLSLRDVFLIGVELTYSNAHGEFYQIHWPCLRFTLNRYFCSIYHKETKSSSVHKAQRRSSSILDQIFRAEGASSWLPWKTAEWSFHQRMNIESKRRKQRKGLWWSNLLFF